ERANHSRCNDTLALASPKGAAPISPGLERSDNPGNKRQQIGDQEWVAPSVHQSRTGCPFGAWRNPLRVDSIGDACTQGSPALRDYLGLVDSAPLGLDCGHLRHQRAKILAWFLR